MTFLTRSRYFIHPNQKLCSSAELHGNWLANPSICVPTMGIWLPDCKNADGCGAFRISESLILDAQLRDWIYTSLQDPCASLQDPKSYDEPAPRNAQGGLLLPLSATWWILSCGSEHPVHATNIEFDKERGLVRFKFQP